MKHFTHRIMVLMLFVIGFIIMPNVLSFSINMDGRLVSVDTNLTYGIKPNDVYLYDGHLDTQTTIRDFNATSHTNSMVAEAYILENITEVTTPNNTYAYIGFEQYITQSEDSALDIRDTTSMNASNLITNSISEGWEKQLRNDTINNNTIKELTSPFVLGDEDRVLLPKHYYPNDTTLQDYFVPQIADGYVMGAVSKKDDPEEPQSVEEFLQYLETLINVTYIDTNTFTKTMVTDYQGTMHEYLRISAMTNPTNFEAENGEDVDESLLVPASINATIDLTITHLMSTQMVLINSSTTFIFSLQVRYINGSYPMSLAIEDEMELNLIYPTNLPIAVPDVMGLLSMWIWISIGVIGILAIGTMWYYRSLCGKPNQDNAMCHIGSKYTNKNKSV